MIQGKEIRIGNYLKDRGGKILRVDFIEYVENGFDTKFGQKMFLQGEELHPMTEYSDYAEPIALSPEWMEKLGLKYLQNACWEFGSMRIYNLSDEENPRYRITLAGHELCIINYVHQLQNFYHSITFKDLSVPV